MNKTDVQVPKIRYNKYYKQYDNVVMKTVYQRKSVQLAPEHKRKVFEDFGRHQVAVWKRLNFLLQRSNADT